jgi:hypothetical protein
LSNEISISLKLAQRENFMAVFAQPRVAADVRQVDDEAAYDDLAALLVYGFDIYLQ